MKNRHLLLILIFFIFFQNTNLVFGFQFKAENIQIQTKKNTIIAFNGKAFSDDNSLEINSNYFEYQKNKGLLKSQGNGLLIEKIKNLKINYDKANFDKNNKIVDFYGNIKVYYKDKKIDIETKKISYNYLIGIISSETQTILKDGLKNIYMVDSFKYEINKDLIKANALVMKDNQKNIIKSEIAFINTKTNKLFGKDIEIDLNSNNSKIFNKENNPRIRARTLEMTDNLSVLDKGIFTSCKKRENCPPWEFKSSEIRHDKIKKTINYKNAVMKIYDVPIAYFPRFFHPDPTVKRQTGFLTPAFKNSSSNNMSYTNIPYYIAIAENKDLTFSPRLYNKDEKILLQTEYRQVNKNNNNIFDFGYLREKNLNSNVHYFLETNKKLSSFENGNVNLKIQQTSNDAYLKSEKIEGEIIRNYNILENTLGLDIFSNNLEINLNATVYEDLNRNQHDRYEYIIPNINIKKNTYNKKLNGNFFYQSEVLVRNYDTNIYENILENNINFKSNSKISKIGFNNNYEFLVKNINSKNKKSLYKNNNNYYLSSIFQYNSTYPLIKKGKSYDKILKPRISFRLAPPHTKNNSDENIIIDTNNIYSLERVSNITTEGGMSITYGNEYSILDTNNSKELLKYQIANNIRLDENDKLPNNSQIGEKTSNFFNKLELNLNKNLEMSYSNGIQNNLKQINYESLLTKIKFNNVITEFDYINDNNNLSTNSFIKNDTTLLINNFNSLKFSTRKNKEKDLTEYYNMMYQYKNDCLTASIEYNKDFYSDRALKPSENIFFKFTIIPFGEASSPNFKN